MSEALRCSNCVGAAREMCDRILSDLSWLIKYNIDFQNRSINDTQGRSVGEIMDGAADMRTENLDGYIHRQRTEVDCLLDDEELVEKIAREVTE